MKRIDTIFIIFLLAYFSINAITRPETDSYLTFVNNHAEMTAEITAHTDSWAGKVIPSDLVLPIYHIPSYPETQYRVIGFYGAGVFRGCSKITSIAIPRGYESIPSTTFIDCENLRSFRWSSGNPEGRNGDYFIENGVLYSSYNVGKMFCYPAGKTDSEFKIPTNCNSIGEYCFYRQRHLKNISFNDGLKNIENCAFYGCEGIMSLTIPYGVTKIGDFAFENCTSLETVIIPASATHINKGAFKGCSKLKLVTIENGVETIKSEAFANCVSLETIIIPASVTTIDERAFAGCSNLKTVILQSGAKKYGADVFDGCNSLNEVRIVDLSGWCQSQFATPLANPVNISKKHNYLGKIITDLAIPNDVNNLGQNVFYGYSPLRSITFPDNLTSISKDAFADCENVSKIIIPDFASWCKIDFITEKSNPLYYAKSLYVNDALINILDIPEGIERLHKYAFVNGDFTEIRISSTIKEIEDATFKGVTSRFIRSYSITPPTIALTAFSSYSATLYVPTESLASYWSHTVWGLFSQIEEIPIDASSISFEESEYELNVNETLHLTVSFDPINTTNKEIVWSSSDESIATVENGVVKAIKEGFAVITATTTNNKSASCRLTINNVLATSIKVLPSELVLTPGATVKLTAQILPENTTNQSIEWSSENENIVIVNQSGVIKTLSVGSSHITATTLDGTNLSAICMITVVPIKIESLVLNPSCVNGQEGEQVQIVVTVLPENVTNKTIAWSSSDERVATVDSYGVVSLLKEGTATITASSTDGSGVSASCNITVRKPKILVSSITLTPSSVDGKEGEQIQINATVLPEDATNKLLAWRSSDESVATVDNNGLVSLLQEGTATITASATDGSGVSAECAVVVTKYAEIEDILTDKNTYVKIFNPSGVLVYEGIYSMAKLVPDYYIVVCDGKNIKIKVD